MQIRRRFGAVTNDAFVAWRMAETCLVLPSVSTDLAVENRWAATALALGKGRAAEPRFQFCKGLAEYRQGRFASSGEWMRRCVVTNWYFFDVAAHMVLAMAQYQMK